MKENYINFNNKKKNIYWIRHGESLSNISNQNNHIMDPKLTFKGIKQCAELKKYLESNKILDNVELIVVSPLNRTLQTCINIINFHVKTKVEQNKIKIISLDEIREQIDHLCHKRDLISKKKSNFKFVDFNCIISDHDSMYKKFNGFEPKTNVISRCKWFYNWLKTRKEKNIIVITHGNFLLPMFNDILIYMDININDRSFFSNCEIRKILL